MFLPASGVHAARPRLPPPQVTGALTGWLTRWPEGEWEARVTAVLSCTPARLGGRGEGGRRPPPSWRADADGQPVARDLAGGGPVPATCQPSAVSDAASDDVNRRCGPMRGPEPQAPAKTPLNSRRVEPFDAGTAFAFGAVFQAETDNRCARDLGAQVLNFWVKSPRPRPRWGPWHVFLLGRAPRPADPSSCRSDQGPGREPEEGLGDSAVECRSHIAPAPAGPWERFRIMTGGSHWEQGPRTQGREWGGGASGALGGAGKQIPLCWPVCLFVCLFVYRGWRARFQPFPDPAGRALCLVRPGGRVPSPGETGEE